jgi:hypothetical protein
MIWHDEQAAKIKALDEMGDHFSLLDRLRSILHQPELYVSGASRRNNRMEGASVQLAAWKLYVVCSNPAHP